MSIQPIDRNELFIVSPMEALVPENHLVRKLEKYIDWSFIYPLTNPLYTDKGRGRVDPVILFKMMFINKLFGIHSMRKTCEEIKVNVAYRWFLGLSFEDEVPNHSTYSQNYKRKFKEANVAQGIFTEVFKQLIEKKLIDPSSIFVDGTHIKANANKNKYNQEEMAVSYSKSYQEELEEEINRDRKRHGKKEQKKKEEPVEIKKCKVSKSDPESGVFHKGEKEKCFAYSANTACDGNGYVLGVEVVAGNVHDSRSFYAVYEEVMERIGKEKIKNVVVDAGYKTPHLCKTIYEQGHVAMMPYKRPMTKKGNYKKSDYVYDEEFDCYLCPEIKVLKYSTTNREGYKEYKSNPRDCEKCKNRGQCTQSKGKQKVVTRHVWEEYKEEVEHTRHSHEWKEIYPKRKETIERVFADAKSKHGMGYTRVKGKKRVTDDVLLLFAAMNMKKMVTYLSKQGVEPSKIEESIQNMVYSFCFFKEFGHLLKKS